MHAKYKILIGIILVIIAVLGICYYVDVVAQENTIKIGSLHTDHDAQLQIANEQKAYEAQGLEVEVKQFNNGGDMLTAMASGDLDIGYLGITPVLSSCTQNSSLRIISGVQTEGSSLIARSNENISSIEDLKGKTVATIGESSIQYILLTKILNDNGMNTDDIEHISMRSSLMVGALKTNQIDAMFVPEPYASLATEAGFGKELAYSGDIVPNHPCCVVVTTDEFIKKNPDKLEKIMAIHENYTNFVNAYPEKAVDLLPADMIIDKGVQTKTLARINFISGLSPEFKQSIMDFMDLEISLGFLNNKINETDLFYDI